MKIIYLVEQNQFFLSSPESWDYRDHDRLRLVAESLGTAICQYRHIDQVAR